MKAKKSYGQHFLHREDQAERIARSLSRQEPYRIVLEIGPGKGMLTQFLLDQSYDLYAVEADPEMVVYLQSHFPELNSKLLAADFLKLDIAQYFGKEQLAIIGNFPYNISSQILIKMIEYRHQIPELVGIFQKEVAQRVVAPPGSKTYGVISVLVQAYYEGEYLFTVDKSAFYPPPKVQSGVIRLIRKKDHVLECDEKLFRTIVKQTFSQRRKMLRNTMKSFFLDGEILRNDFFQQRPERLSVDDFVQLTQWVEEARGK